VVPANLVRDYEKTYERITDYVVPRSSLKIAEDKDTIVYRVVVFRKVVEDFKNLARENKFTVREFKLNDDSKTGKADKKKLEAEKEKQRKILIRWCKTNFSEAFVAWIHLKAIRVFVESVLRYGLPTNFQAMLMLPKQSKVKRLRKVLQDLYGHLSSKGVFDTKDDEETDGAATEKFFPYVFLEIPLDFRQKNLY